MPTAPPLLSVADLADGGAELPLDERGRPGAALALVDLERLPAYGADAVLDRAVAAAAASQRVLVGIAPSTPLPPEAASALDALTCTLVPRGTRPPGLSTCVAVDDVADAVEQLAQSVAACPQAATTLVVLLRLTSRLDVADGLVAESLAYSMLLAGSEFSTWRASRPRRPVPEPTAPPVLLERDDDRLTVTLNRPDRRNAYGRAVRDALVEALAVALRDPSVKQVRLRGAGSAFCSGGDLDEFGTTPDVVAAHAVRLERSAAVLLHRCRDRVRAEVHGACVGAGIELPAFASEVVAHGDAWFQLPELRMGLVPGAGGTVSVTRRVGRWRTAWMALSGQAVDLATALEWGLVDRRADG